MRHQKREQRHPAWGDKFSQRSHLILEYIVPLSLKYSLLCHSTGKSPVRKKVCVKSNAEGAGHKYCKNVQFSDGEMICETRGKGNDEFSELREMSNFPFIEFQQITSSPKTSIFPVFMPGPFRICAPITSILRDFSRPYNKTQNLNLRIRDVYCNITEGFLRENLRGKVFLEDRNVLYAVW